RSPSISRSPSMCGMPTLRTAVLPSGRVAGATHEQLISSANGSPSFNAQRRCSSRTTFGSASSQRARSSVLAHVSARRSGIGNPVASVIASQRSSNWIWLKRKRLKVNLVQVLEDSHDTGMEVGVALDRELLVEIVDVV